MKELVVISGKGGTGKTSIVASFASLASSVVLADCDVDAADLHLVLRPTVRSQWSFSGGMRAAVLDAACSSCGTCERLCRFEAITRIPRPNRSERFEIDPIACEGCGVCVQFCPTDAIAFGPAVNGQWFVSDTRCGPMVHARLDAGEANSGKLVSLVRTEAKRIAADRGLDLLLADGPPGIGCPVIASMAGADNVLIVTEPTLSGLHDLQRAMDLARHFNIESLVCINKWDLNKTMTSAVEQWAQAEGVVVAGRVRYDPAVTRAQIEQESIVEHCSDGVAADVRRLWEAVSDHVIAEPKG